LKVSTKQMAYWVIIFLEPYMHHCTRYICNIVNFTEVREKIVKKRKKTYQQDEQDTYVGAG
jgi:hypothetical protein